MNKHFGLLIFLVALLSCNKNRDETYPTIQIISPGTNTNHTVLQAINFKVSASDETHLDRITVHLLTASYLPAATPVTMNCDENSETFENYLLPDDIHLPTGTYFIKAVATDGFNEKVAYREIHLNEVPRVLENVWVITNPSTNVTRLDTISGTTLSNAQIISADHSLFISHSYYKMIVEAGGSTGNLLAMDGIYLTNYFTITNTGSGAYDFFTSLLSLEDKFFVADHSGKIKSYRKSQQAVDVISLGNYYAEAFCILDDFITTVSINLSGGQREIQVYYLSSGVFYQSSATNLSTKKMFSLNSDETLLFGNESGLGKIKLFSSSGNNETEPIVFSGGLIYDVCRVDASIFLIAHSNGVHLYDYSTSSQSAILTGNAHQLVRYEDLGNTFYTAYGNSVGHYSLSTVNLIQNYMATDSITGLDLLYNK